MENYLIPVIPYHKQVLVSGEGSYVYDSNGKKYLDLNSGQFCTIFGHANKDLTSVVTDMADKLVHTSSGIVSDVVLEAARALHQISGEMKAYSIFLSTGGEAVEFAIRYAKHLTKREGIVCFNKGYHGLTLGAQSITFGGIYAKPAVSNVFSVPIPDTFATEENIAKHIVEFEQLMKLHSNKIAAVVMEPVVSVGGMIFPAYRYFEHIAAICQKSGTLLVFDECQTGFGRTGKWFCYQHMDVVPDMVVCAKGMGLGYPLSTVMMKQNLACGGKITMTHYSSHQNDPFAGIAQFAISYIQEKGLISRVEKMGALFLKKLESLCADNDMYQNPRGQGLMLGVDLYIKGVSNYRHVFQKLENDCAAKGILIQGTDGGRVLRFLPDYFIKEEDIDLCVNVLKSIRYEGI